MYSTFRSFIAGAALALAACSALQAGKLSCSVVNDSEYDWIIAGPDTAGVNLAVDVLIQASDGTFRVKRSVRGRIRARCTATVWADVPSALRGLDVLIWSGQGLDEAGHGHTLSLRPGAPAAPRQTYLIDDNGELRKIPEQPMAAPGSATRDWEAPETITAAVSASALPGPTRSGSLSPAQAPPLKPVNESKAAPFQQRDRRDKAMVLSLYEPSKDPCAPTCIGDWLANYGASRHAVLDHEPDLSHLAADGTLLVFSHGSSRGLIGNAEKNIEIADIVSAINHPERGLPWDFQGAIELSGCHNGARPSENESLINWLHQVLHERRVGRAPRRLIVQQIMHERTATPDIVKLLNAHVKGAGGKDVRERIVEAFKHPFSVAEQLGNALTATGRKGITLTGPMGLKQTFGTENGVWSIGIPGEKAARVLATYYDYYHGENVEAALAQLKAWDFPVGRMMRKLRERPGKSVPGADAFALNALAKASNHTLGDQFYRLARKEWDATKALGNKDAFLSTPNSRRTVSVGEPAALGCPPAPFGSPLGLACPPPRPLTRGVKKAMPAEPAPALPDLQGARPEADRR